MIYIYIVVLESSSVSEKILKFEGVLTIYGLGGHLGHVTWIIYIQNGSPSYRCFI